MPSRWNLGDSVPDRWLLALEAGTATLDETTAALAAYQWPESTPAKASGDTDPFPAVGWVHTVDAAHNEGRITDQQYEALFWACRWRVPRPAPAR